MSNEISIKSRLQSINGDQHIDEIPNDENNFDGGKSKLLINETKEFIPKSHYESKSNFANLGTKISDLENLIKCEEENLQRIQTFDYDKLSESNRIEVKMIQLPLLNKEELHCKRSDASFAFETENSLKGDLNSNCHNNYILNDDSDNASKKNLINSAFGLNIIGNINGNLNNAKNSNMEILSFYNFSNNSENNKKHFDNFNPKAIKYCNNNYNNEKNQNFDYNDKNLYYNNNAITGNFDQNLINNDFNKQVIFKDNSAEYLCDEDIILVEKGGKILFSKTAHNPSIRKKSNSQVILNTLNNPILPERNNLQTKNLVGAVGSNRINNIESVKNQNDFSNDLNQNNGNSLSYEVLTQQKNNISLNQNFNLKLKNLNMDNLNVQKIIEHNENNNAIENQEVTNGDCKQKLIIHSGKDSQKNGRSKGLLDELPSEEIDNAKLKSAFNLENNIFNQVNTSNTLQKNEIDLIAYNSGNMGEVRPKRCNKNNVCM